MSEGRMTRAVCSALAAVLLVSSVFLAASALAGGNLRSYPEAKCLRPDMPKAEALRDPAVLARLREEMNDWRTCVDAYGKRARQDQQTIQTAVERERDAYNQAKKTLDERMAQARGKAPSQ